MWKKALELCGTEYYVSKGFGDWVAKWLCSDHKPDTTDVSRHLPKAGMSPFRLLSCPFSSIKSEIHNIAAKLLKVNIITENRTQSHPKVHHL